MIIVIDLIIIIICWGYVSTSYGGRAGGFITIQFGTVWYSLVQFGTVWFSLVQFGSVWFSLVQFGAVWCSLVLGSVVKASVFTLPPMLQPPKGLQARNPLGTPALAHVSLACFAGSLDSSFRWRDGFIIASPRQPFGPTQALFKTASQCCRIPAHDA